MSCSVSAREQEAGRQRIEQAGQIVSQALDLGGQDGIVLNKAAIIVENAQRFTGPVGIRVNNPNRGELFGDHHRFDRFFQSERRACLTDNLLSSAENPVPARPARRERRGRFAVRQQEQLRGNGPFGVASPANWRASASKCSINNSDSGGGLKS